MRLPRGLRRALAWAVALAGSLAGASASAATRLEAQLSRSGIETGSSTTLVLRVIDPQGDVGEPRLELPAGTELLGRDRAQSFSWVNGRSSSEVTFRFEIGARRQGRYRIGPVRIAVGRQGFLSNTLELTVSEPSAAGPPAGGRGPAALLLDLEPRDPHVGELCVLRVRLVQRVALAEASQYQPPAATGFWTERWSEPVSYESREGTRPVVVMERRLRLYPLAAGDVRVGQAIAAITPASGGGDPFFGGLADQPREVRSDSLRVRVRPLPEPAPAGFDAAVGRFDVRFTLDRDHTTRDQAVIATLDVRGEGNLPLLKTPAWTPPDFEVFGSSIEDSLAPAGERGPGRRSFRWTLVPRREGALSLVPPAFAWFDPQSGAYHSAPRTPARLEVLAARAVIGDAGHAGWPEAFTRERARPGGRPASPWAGSLAGLAMGAAAWFATRRERDDPRAAERAHQRELLRAVGLARGPDFWRAADEALAWSEVRGERVLRLREEVHTARYGGRAADEESVRGRVVERLSEALPPLPAAPPRRWFLALAVVAALLAWWFAAPRPGEPALADRARAADAAAHAGRIDEAESQWRALWREAPGDPALAARLAWASLEGGRAADAACWVLLGRRGEPRSRSLAAIEDRLRERGGLTGAGSGPLPLKSLEWAALACALAVGAVLELERRRLALALLALSLTAAIAPLAIANSLADPAWRVVAAEAPLEGADVLLAPGEVVRAEGGVTAGGIRVRAGRRVSGRIAAEALRSPAEVSR